jgi:hypothetical protein
MESRVIGLRAKLPPDSDRGEPAKQNSLFLFDQPTLHPDQITVQFDNIAKAEKKQPSTGLTRWPAASSKPLHWRVLASCWVVLFFPNHDSKELDLFPKADIDLPVVA